jgi:hypothetical protein
LVTGGSVDLCPDGALILSGVSVCVVCAPRSTLL